MVVTLQVQIESDRIFTDEELEEINGLGACLCFGLEKYNQYIRLQMCIDDKVYLSERVR